MNVVTILDCFTVDSRLSKRTLLVMKYDKKRNIPLQDMAYFPYLRYPYKGVGLLNTCKEQINNFYLSYSDQDMEQMIL